MKLFADTANLKEIADCLERGAIQGITTNPSLLAKEPNADLFEFYGEIVKLCKAQPEPIPLSVEAVTADASEMIEQAREVKERLAYEHLNFKVPLGNRGNAKSAWNELKAIHSISRFMDVNATCLYTPQQAVMAANAGARYVSLFFARSEDLGLDATGAVSATRELLDGRAGGRPVEIIAGSIRTPKQALDAWLAGADIVTTSVAVMQSMTYHLKSQESVDDFLKDYENWAPGQGPGRPKAG